MAQYALMCSIIYKQYYTLYVNINKLLRNYIKWGVTSEKVR